MALKIGDNGRFRILMVSDFHMSKNSSLPVDYTGKMIKGFNVLLDETKPDFVMIGGDQCISGETREEVRKAFEPVMAPVIDRGLPWAAVFGNHDNEMGLPVSEEEKVYESMPGYLGQSGPNDIDGTGNYCLTVMSNDGSKAAWNLFALDSHREITDFIDMFGLDKDTKMILPEHFNEGATGAAPTFEQVMWYYNTSKQIEKSEGRKIPAVMFMHIPILEYLHITRNPEECDAVGNKRETLGCCELNFGLFGACLQRGDVKGMFFGHEHLCDIQGEYCGITMAQDAALGYNMSCHDDLRGGRVIDLYEDGTMQTHSVKLIDLMGLDAMRRKDYFEGGCKYFIRKL